MSLPQKNKRKRLIWIGVVLGALADLVTKGRIFSRSRDSQLITPIINPGAARSINIDVAVLIAFTILAVICLIFLHYRRLISGWSFLLVTAGALGNAYDRVVFGGVRDRIHISIFPIFNLADIMITLGVLLIAIHYRRQSRLERAK